MEKLRQELEVKQLELLELRLEVSSRLEDAPDGRLRITNTKKKPLYYPVQNTHSASGNYIKKDNNLLARKLAQKAYDQKLLKELNLKLSAIEQTLSGCDNSLDTIYQALTPARKELITPSIMPDEQYISLWLTEGSNQQNDFPFENQIFTANGEQVRSKSEKIIADSLFLKRIPYKYESPLKVGDHTLFPDFTILNVRKRKVYYLEHFGCMDNPSYLEKALLRIERYELAGIFPGDQLLITHETLAHPLNSLLLEQLITNYLL